MRPVRAAVPPWLQVESSGSRPSDRLDRAGGRRTAFQNCRTVARLWPWTDSATTAPVS